MITYTPAANYTGPDSFSYRVKDNLGADSNVATVSITVNAPPLASNDTATTNQNVAAVINVLGNDSDSDGTLDPTSVTIVSPAGHGTTSVNPTTGAITYTPAANYTGPDSFSYRVKDNLGAESNVATVSITVNAPPLASNDTATTNQNVAAVINVLGNDSDSDGTLDPTSVTIVSPAGHGTTSVNPTTGAITYTPAANYTGPDSFSYKVKDNRGADSNVATVSITVVGTVAGAITGTVYFDVTGNGLSADDTPQAGVKVYLDSNNNGTWNSGEPVATSLDDGTFTFSGLAAATYKVRQVVPTGYVRTAPALTDVYSVTLGSGQTSSGNNFANAEKGDLSILSNIVYVINGTTAVSDLVGKTKEGDTVQVSFTVVAGATPDRYTLVSYTAPGKTFDPATAAQQEIFQMDTGIFGPGSYTLDVRIPHSYFQVDFVIGSAIEPFGPAGSNIFYSAQTRLVSYDNGGSKPMASNASSLSGFVYHDANDNGAYDAGERPIPGAAVNLSGKDSKNKSVSQSVVTDSDGRYQFSNLPAGTYTIAETQPLGYTDGSETLGTRGGSKGNDKFTSIKLAASASGENYNFGEKQTVGSALAGNQTDATSFWAGSSGQNLVKALNGSQNAKNLGNWLASNFGNLFGSAAGSSNNLAGKTNSQVAAYFATLYSNSSKRAEAETLALAFNVYVTTSSLAGNVASSYGFAVSSNGLGASTVGVGTAGAALGVDNNAILTVSELLVRINARSRKGLIWDANGDGRLSTAETVLSNQALSLLAAINNT